MKLQTLKPRIATMTATRLASPARPRISDKSGHAWAKIRIRILRRDCGLCQPCKKKGVTTLAAQVDHIVALQNGGSDDDGNLQAICHDCHAAKTAVEARVRGGGCAS